MKWVWVRKKDNCGRYIPGSGHFVEATKVASQPRIHVIGALEAFESPITGEVMHSRGQYAAHLSDFGYHVKEPGDTAKRAAPDRGAIRNDVKQTLQKMGVVG